MAVWHYELNGTRHGPLGEAELKRAAVQAPELAGPALSALAAAPHGRFFLRPSAARAFLKA